MKNNLPDQLPTYLMAPVAVLSFALLFALIIWDAGANGDRREARRDFQRELACLSGGGAWIDGACSHDR